MKQIARLKHIEAVKSRLNWPRAQISIILLLTALVGFLTSALLLHAGLDSMAVRYPVAIAIAYGLFLLLLRLWISFQNLWNIDVPLEINNSTIEYFDFSQYPFEGRGDFAGAGAGGKWTQPNPISAPTTSDSNLGGSNFSFDIEDIGLLILAAVAILAALLAVFYIIYIAPVLLAEIFVDGVLVAGLYKSVKEINQGHWLLTALRKTLIPAVLAAILFGTAGYIVQNAVPEARSIGQVWMAIKGS